MKKINIYNIVLFVLFLVTAFACDKKEVVQINNSKSPEKAFYLNGTNQINITIRRKWKWKITFKPSELADCHDGRGLCISGDPIPPNPGDTTDYHGILANHISNTTKVIFLFPDDLIEDEDDLIANDLFEINENVDVGIDIAEELGFSQAFTILSGNYTISDDGSGMQAVVVDIEF